MKCIPARLGLRPDSLSRIVTLSVQTVPILAYGHEATELDYGSLKYSHSLHMMLSQTTGSCKH